MEKRVFGRTGHLGTVAIFGAACLSEVNQQEADRAVEAAIEAGVNTIDIAPSYGQAELRLGPWIPRIREHVFLACKTEKRDKDAAKEALHQSLERLNTTFFDLYQFHDVTKIEELDRITAPGGALEAFVEARQQGLIKYMGITGHGLRAPAVYLEAMKRMDLDSILFSIYPGIYANPQYRKEAQTLLAECQKRNVAVMVINATARGPWQIPKPHPYTVWYEPFDDMPNIQERINFVLSQNISGYCTVGDVKLLPLNLQACANYTPMSAVEQEALVERASHESALNFFE